MNINFAWVEVRIPCPYTISVHMVVLVLESFLVFPLALNPHEIMLLVSDAILAINFSHSEIVWPISDVSFASRSTLFDTGTNID